MCWNLECQDGQQINNAKREKYLLEVQYLTPNNVKNDNIDMLDTNLLVDEVVDEMVNAFIYKGCFCYPQTILLWCQSSAFKDLGNLLSDEVVEEMVVVLIHEVVYVIIVPFWFGASLRYLKTQEEHVHI